MSTLPVWARRLLAKELRFVAEGMEFDREAAQKILALLAPRKKNEKQRASAKRKAGAAQAAGARSAEIRRKVKDRAAGECEAAKVIVHGDADCEGPLEWDHWRGGSGNRKKFESVETTWMPCRGHHQLRQQNDPSAEFWNTIFRRHCEWYGYRFTAHVEHARLPERAAR